MIILRVKQQISRDNRMFLADLSLLRYFMNARVDTLASSCLDWRCISPVEPGRPLFRTRDGHRISPFVVTDGTRPGSTVAWRFPATTTETHADEDANDDRFVACA